MVLGGSSGDGGVGSSSCLYPGSPHLSSHPSSPPGTPIPSVHPPVPTIAVLLAASHCTKHRSVAGACGGVGWMRTMGSCKDLALPSQLPPSMPATPGSTQLCCQHRRPHHGPWRQPQPAGSGSFESRPRCRRRAHINL
jgi:hypothetical protein